MAKDSTMNKIPAEVPGIVALVGAAVFFLGMLWTSIAANSGDWTDKKAAEFAAASRSLHESAHHSHAGSNDHSHEGHDHGAEDSHESREKVKDRFERLSNELQSAQQAPKLAAKKMKIAGGALFGVGLVALMVRRTQG